jgi:superfamily II DNA helicase RecQ
MAKHWSITQFRPYQRDIINCTLSGNDVVVILSTGSGKSLCFQLPGIYSSGLTLVISPLISLIVDQVYDLRRSKIKAEMVSLISPFFNHLKICR